MDYLFIYVAYQKRLKKERRARRRLQDQLDLEVKRRTQLEDALKATGATTEQVRSITENVKTETRTSVEQSEENSIHSQSQQSNNQQPNSQSPVKQSQQQQQQQSQQQQQQQQQQKQQTQQYREAQVSRPPQQPPTPEKPGWGYSGLDLISNQFWQNYQDSRAGYYKNSVLFTSAT